ncbi:MAG: tail fiber domain-containing protein [Saprospiraceae bacterium]|nr:tail fiber domain-containing protein [Saprospiraceae bacterium]
MKDTLRSSNVYVGHGIDGLQGNANVVVGTHAGAGAVGSANVIIGSQAGANLTGSNRLVIENGSSLDPLIYGEFDNAVLGFHADVGIGTSAPSEALHVAEGNALLDRGTSTGSLTRSLRINGARSLAGTDYAQIQFSNYDENSSASDIVRAMISSTNANGTGNGDLRLHTYDGTLTERMRIEGGGNVGFGNINPSHPLEMASGAHVTAAGVWTNASDISRKKNIRPQPYGLEEVLKMRPTSYEYRADGTTSIGFIAQDIEQIIPEVVSGEDGNKGIAYGLLVSTLVHAVQEQQVMIEQLQQEISRMRQQATGTRLTSNK